MVNESSLLREKTRDLEDRSRRNNLGIDGLKEAGRESWEDTEVKIQNIFRNQLGVQLFHSECEVFEPSLARNTP